MPEKTPEEIAAEVAEAQRLATEAEAARIAAAAAQHEEEELEEEDDLPAENDEEDPAAEILATRFKNDPLKATRAFASANQLIGKQGTVLGEQKKILEGLGYTFDDKGMPVAPVKAEVKPVEMPAPRVVPGTQYVVSADNGWHVDPSTGRQYDPSEDYQHEGKTYHAWRDKFGTFEFTDADWEYMRTTNPDHYSAYRPKYEGEKWRNEQAYYQKLEKTANANLPTARAAFEAEVAKLPVFSTSPVIKGILDRAEQMVREQPVEARSHPMAYQAAVVVELLKDPASWISDLEQRITDQVNSSVGTRPRIVATEGASGGGINAGQPAVKVEIPVDMERERRKFNSARRASGQPEITAKQWMENS